MILGLVVGLFGYLGCVQRDELVLNVSVNQSISLFYGFFIELRS
jgi:hypothetical protein